MCYVLSEVSRSESGYTHTLKGIYLSRDTAIENMMDMQNENSYGEYVVEPWPLEL